jgi:hypothetical protein
MVYDWIYDLYIQEYLLKKDTRMRYKLKNLLENILMEDDAAIAKEMEKAFKAGPAATRAFFNSELGKSAEAKALLQRPAAERDGVNPDDKIKVSGPRDVPVDPSKVLPTQNFIDAMQSIAYPLGSASSLASAITRKKGFGTIVMDWPLIIDGHHRWSGVVAITPDGVINALNIQWPGKSTAKKLAAAQMAVAATVEPGKEQPSASGDPATDILGKSADAIKAMILKNINKQTDPKAPGALLNDDMMASLTDPDSKDAQTVANWLNLDSVVTDVDELRDLIASRVGENLSAIQSNPQAPGRADMPQFDTKKGGPEIDDIKSDLAAGEYNVSPPFIKKEEVRRMKVLAGIIR